MFKSGTISVLLLLTAADNIFIGSPATAQFLPNVNTLGLLSQSFLQQQFPFQLLSTPQFGNLLTLFYNISNFRPQTSNQPQSEGNTAPTTRRVLNPLNPSSSNSIYTTLPFNDLNLTEFSWIWENVFANGSNINLNSSNQEVLRPQTKLFGGGNNGSNAFGDLNFSTVPQYLNLIGRR